MLCLVSVVVYLFGDEDFTSGMRLKSLPPSSSEHNKFFICVKSEAKISQRGNKSALHLIHLIKVFVKTADMRA